MTTPLSGALHELLTAHCAQERNKELALALITAANRGGTNRLTRYWGDDSGLRLTCESVVADGDRVALRVTARTERASWTLLGELRFDEAGGIVEYYDVLVPLGDGPGE
ncbi:hypothetical protein [Streptomyces sp. NPDC047000]|uniref:hypothetical protein n=1 Tax=Streptomyces sp. NPDC047000 TaxID=3155474 RepID=UPI0033F691F7